MKKELFFVDKWAIEPAARRISDGQHSTTVEYKVMQVLLCLVRNGRDVVTREELLDTVWEGTVVGDGVLTRAVSELRKAFRDDRSSPEIIETIPRVGYRLLVPAKKSEVFEEHRSPARRQVAAFAPGILAVGVAVIVVALFVFLTGYVSRPSGMSFEFGRSVRLTSDVGLEIHPALSADGSRLVYSKAQSYFEDHDLILKLVGSESELQLTQGPARDVFPAWSPDATRIAFVRTLNDECRIMIVGAYGGTVKQVAKCIEARSLAWSPGGQLIYSDQGGTTSAPGLVAISLDGSVKRQITLPDSSTFDMYPTFSSDGSKLALVRRRHFGGGTIIVRSMTDGSERLIASTPHSITGLTWLDDDEHIGYSSYHGDSFAFWRVPEDGGRATNLAERLFSGLGSISDPIWSSRGDLTYVHTQYVTGLRQVIVDAEEVLRSAVSESTQSESRPQYSPDGSKVVFISNRTGLPQLWVRETSSGQGRPLTDLEGHFVGVPVWSKGADHVVFSFSSTGQNADVFSVQLETGIIRRLTSAPADDISPSFSLDGERLYVSSHREGKWRVLSRKWQPTARADSTSPNDAWALLDQPYAMAAQEGPAGTFLYYVKEGTNGIWRIPVAGGEEELVVPSLIQIEDWANWFIEEDGIYFVRRQRDHTATVSKWTFDSRAVEDIVGIGRPQRNSGITKVRNELHFLYTHTVTSESDIVRVQSGDHAVKATPAALQFIRESSPVSRGAGYRAGLPVAR